MAYLLGIAVGQHLGPHAFTVPPAIESPINNLGAD
jgi:hypothetical protein